MNVNVNYSDYMDDITGKQIIKNIPRSDHDVIINWIVTEDRIIDTSKIR